MPPRSRRANRYTPDEGLTGHAQYSADIRLVDLSPSGALLENFRPLQAGAELTLTLPLGDRELNVRALVVHCTPHEPERRLAGERTVYRTGVKFMEMDPSVQELIRRHIIDSLNNERREQPRLYIGRPAQLSKDVEIRVLNLSPFGGLFSVRHPLEFDSEHDFRFSLPKGDVRARGVVRHCEAWAQSEGAAIFRIGVEFTELYGNGRHQVRDYLDNTLDI